MKKMEFLWDVFLCALASYGGPEAHYGIFSQRLVAKKAYIDEDELTELIGLYSLMPGPGSTQTITAIGYHVGGPVLAALTFLVWAFPAIIIMALFGIFHGLAAGQDQWKNYLTYLPYAALAFIIYAAFRMSRKVLTGDKNFILYGLILVLGYFVVGKSIWSVPGLLVLAGFVTMFPHLKDHEKQDIKVQPDWKILWILIGIAIINELAVLFFKNDLLTLFVSFYRFGYSAMGGGQVVIPLMISDLVEGQALLSLEDFLSGYAIDQAVPGPLFSFAAFVSARSISQPVLSFIAGLIGGLAIFLPGILLVYFTLPLWQALRQYPVLKSFLRGVSTAVAALVTLTAIQSAMGLSFNPITVLFVIISTLILIHGKFPAPIVIVMAFILPIFI